MAALPGVRAFHVDSTLLDGLHGLFLTELPVELRHLSVGCLKLPSEVVAQLSQYTGLRSLALRCWSEDIQPADVAACLANCVHLQRLVLSLKKFSAACLPPAGLTELRHLDLSLCSLTDADLDWLLARLPDIESLSLRWCRGLSQRGLASLGHLSALSFLSLAGTDGVCYKLLKAVLSALRLVELELGDFSLPGNESSSSEVLTIDTARGLYGLLWRHNSLRTLVLRDGLHEERISCERGQTLYWVLRDCLNKLTWKEKENDLAVGAISRRSSRHSSEDDGYW